MFKSNVGMVDRALRVIVGAALLISFFLFPDLAYRWALLIGVVPLVTGLSGRCPAYSLFGWNTCAVK